MISGAVLERTFNAGEKLPRARIERREAQFLYSVDEDYTFMDLGTYDQTTITKSILGDRVLYLKENSNVHIMTYEDKVIGVDIPNFVELEVVDTDPGFKGDTATGGTKQATLETGAVLKVPLFINIGDVLKVDTRTGEYMGRV